MLFLEVSNSRSSFRVTCGLIDFKHPTHRADRDFMGVKHGDRESHVSVKCRVKCRLWLVGPAEISCIA